MPQEPYWNTMIRMSPEQRWEVFFALVKDGNATGTVTKLVSSNPNVVAVNVMADGVVEVRAVGMETADISYTDENGKVYTIPVTVDLPEVGYYTSATPSANTLVTNGFVVNGIGDKLYLIARNGMIFNNVTLNGDFNNFATVSVDSTNTIATITFTDIPEYFGEYGVFYDASNPNNGWNSRGDYWVGLINGMPHLEFVYSDDNGTNVFDSMWVTPGGQTDGWINYADANGKEYAFDVIADFDNVGAGFFTDDEFKKENYMGYEFEATNSNNVIYFMSHADYDIDNFKLLYDTDKYAVIEVISKHCAKITITDKIVDLVKYGEAIDFVMSYEMHNNFDGGTWTNYEGFMLTNKMCKHEKVDTVNEKAPACTVIGYTGDDVCRQCKDVVKKGTDIPATGHIYVDGVCKACGDKPVVADKVDKVDTTKPVEEVTPVINQAAADTTAKDVLTVVDAILADKVTSDVKESVSEDTIKEIKAELEAGKQITTEIKAEVVEEKDLNKEVVKEIKDELGEAGKVAQFLDLSVIIKSVAGDGTEKELGTLNVLSEKITFTIMVPAELAKEGREFYVIRVHDGKAEKLDLTKNADGTYSFETDRFSSYALAYDETVSTDTTPDATPDKTPEAPKTGDATNGLIYVVLLVGGLVAFVSAKKKGYYL